MNTEDNDDRIDDSPLDRTRRHVLLGAGTALTVGIAGCSDGNDDSGENDSDDEDDSDGEDGATETTEDGGMAETTDDGMVETPDDSPTGSSMGEVVENTVDELELVDWRSTAGFGTFRVTVTVENTGSQSTALDSYTWGLRIYDESGEEIEPGGPISATAVDSGGTGAGETGEVQVRAPTRDAGDVDSYELSLTCDGSDGAYCSG